LAKGNVLQSKRLRDIALNIHKKLEFYKKVHLQAFGAKCAKNLALLSAKGNINICY
jgi:hypothetical protein